MKKIDAVQDAFVPEDDDLIKEDLGDDDCIKDEAYGVPPVNARAGDYDGLYDDGDSDDSLLEYEDE